MRYLKFTYVGSKSGVPVTEAPAADGPAFPPVTGLEFSWARESKYPTDRPEFFGTCPDNSSTSVPGVLAELSQADWEAAHAEELGARTQLLVQRITDATQKRLDDFAKTRNYDGILSLCTYATDPRPQFNAEGQYGVEVRGATWAQLYRVLAEVQAGVRPMPSVYSDVEPELPNLEWPT